MADPQKSDVRLENDEQQLRLAVLIDADNAQASLIEALLGEVATLGEATVRRIYGDFTSQHSASWKKVLQRHAIKPVHQFAYSTGKNSTDSTLIIDAMDLLYTRRFDGFCLVTSDSDFTGLAMRLREEGLMVFGFGERKTPDAFRNACHRFTFVEVLREARSRTTEESDAGGDPAPEPPAQGPGTESRPAKHKFPRKFMLAAVEDSSDDSGWTRLDTLGSYLIKRQPDFDSRLYGYRKLSDLVRARDDIFTTEERQSRTSDQKILYVRAK